MSFLGYEDGVYTYFIEDEYPGPMHYFRFAMPTPTTLADFSKVKVEVIHGE